jgi:hypothetical protein
VTRIVTINGIHESAASTTDVLADVLAARGFAVTKLQYPTRSAFQTRNIRQRHLDARKLLDQIPEAGPVDAIFHSYGNLLGATMMEQGGSYIFRRIVGFAPALNRDWVFPREAFERMVVVHNPQDRAVWYAEHLFGFSHPWGDMGRRGYYDPQHPDPRITNHEDKARRRWLGERMHCHYFHPPHLTRWAKFCAEFFSLP